MSYNFDFANCSVKLTAEAIVIDIAEEPTRRVVFISSMPSQRRIVTTAGNLRLYIETPCNCELRILDVKGKGLVQFRPGNGHSLVVKRDTTIDGNKGRKLGVVVHHSGLSNAEVDQKITAGRKMGDRELVQHSEKWSKQLLQEHDFLSEDEKPRTGWASLEDLAGAEALGKIFWEKWDEADEAMFEDQDALYMGKKATTAD